MTVEVLYFDGCPNHEALLPRLRELLQHAGAPTQITLVKIDDDEVAQREHFLGSPTVRINGRDIEPDADERTDFGLKCRLYQTVSGLSGQPDEAWVTEALRRGESE